MTGQVKIAIKKWSMVIVMMIMVEYLCHFAFNLGLIPVSVFIYSCIVSFVLIILTTLLSRLILQNKKISTES